MCDSGPVLLYDGLCGMCNGAVRFILERDPAGALRFASLQGDYAAGVLAEHPGTAGVDSILYVVQDAGGDTRVLSRSDAVFAVARDLGGAWTALALGRLLPRVLRDGLYDLIARNRRRIVGALTACPTPPPGQGHRFLP